MPWRVVLYAALLLLAGCQARDSPNAANANVSNPPANTDTNQRLTRWQQLGYGMFIHWGLYSQLGGVWQGQAVREGYSEQIQGWAGISMDEYATVAQGFSAAGFDAEAICQLARDAGARYIVVTSKHHDGFVMFETTSTDYNIVQRTPFARDPLALLSRACRNIGVGFGVYFSLVDWHAGHTPEVEHNSNPIPAQMEPLIEQQLTELMTGYGPITEVWFDMSAPTPAQSRRFVDIVRQHQPDAAINGRIWNNAGDFITLGDNQPPPVAMLPPFQVPASIYHATWGYRSWQVRDDAAGKVRELVRGLVQARAAGGNYLINIGPDGDGAVVPFEAEVLSAMGQWLRRYGHAPLDAQPADLPPQPWGSVMMDADGLLLFVHDWRAGELVVTGLAGEPRAVQVLGGEQDRPELSWHRRGDDLVIALPAHAPDPVLPVLRVTYDGPVPVVWPGSVRVPATGDVHLAFNAWQPRTRFAFSQSYFTQSESTVALDAGIHHDADVSSLWLRFLDVEAAAGQRYRVSVGGQSIEATTAMLADEAIGPFARPADASSTRIRIELAAPDYLAQPLDLRFAGVTVSAQSSP